MKMRWMKAGMILAALLATVAGRAEVVTFGSGTNQFAMDFVSIGGAGNAAQSSANRDHSVSGGDGLGAVSYGYQIGKYEVTINQIVKAQAASGNTICGTNENYWQASKGSNAPAVRVSFYEAAKLCNWMTSGNATNGAYTFDVSGNFTGINRAAATASYATVYVLPSRDEWFKAAYYDIDNAKYTLYAFGVNTAPVAGIDARYNTNSVWAVGSGSVEQNGTYDMMGNVWEWSEQAATTNTYRVLGGSYQLATNYMYSASSSTLLASDDTKYQFGFRVVAIPEPATVSLFLISSVGAFMCRRYL